jgi:copper(I)-binding protein
MPCFRLRLFAALAAAGLLLGPTVHAVQSGTDGVMVHDAWARATAGNSASGAAYLTVTGGGAADELVGVRASVATTAGVHESFTDNGVMKMRPVHSLSVPAGKTVTLAPGGYHIMLMGLKQPLTAGQSFPLTVTFAHAGEVTVEVKVQALGRAVRTDDHEHMQMH